MTNKEQAQRPPAELLYADELTKLAKSDDAQKPPGWKLSLKAVRAFLCGDEKLGIDAKFVGDPALIERAMVSLVTLRGLLLVGEPGTAKSMLSELLAAAISGDSSLVIQGGAATGEEQIKYGWNYALLINEGPTQKALVPGPLHAGMAEGKLVRFEEITRCPSEVQDSLLSVLSDRVMAIPELADAKGSGLLARPGFNVIATANTRDRGVNEMSAALKRRFNFETVHPISSFDVEFELVQREAAKALKASGVEQAPPKDMIEVLVHTFRDLRGGQPGEGGTTERLNSVMSTAEAVSVAHAAGIRAHYLRGGEANAGDIIDCLSGVAVKDHPEDLQRVRRYLEQRVSKRKGAAWRALYEARHRLG
ncbi:MAG: AAA family ATPase [Myxococcota bacterium]